MRVKLSYTVDSENVLKECAKILNLSGDDLQHSIALFNAVQEELKGEKSEDDIVNIKRVKDMIEEFREALLSVDTRLMEVSEIVAGYDDYQRSQGAPPTAPEPVVPLAPQSPEDEE